jgi:hypothetical protein
MQGTLDPHQRKGDDDGKGVLGGERIVRFRTRRHWPATPSSPARRSRPPAGGFWRAKAYEAGVIQRVVIVEFESVAKSDGRP